MGIALHTYHAAHKSFPSGFISQLANPNWIYQTGNTNSFPDDWDQAGACSHSCSPSRSWTAFTAPFGLTFPSPPRKTLPPPDIDSLVPLSE